MAIYEHGAEAADEVAAELQDAVREMVLLALEPGTVGKLSWSTAGFPTLASLDGLSGLHPWKQGSSSSCLTTSLRRQPWSARMDTCLQSGSSKQGGACHRWRNLLQYSTSVWGRQSWRLAQ